MTVPAVEPLEQITDLLGLNANGYRVAWAKLYGYGSNARAVIAITNGSADVRELHFDSVGSMGQPRTLLTELAIVAGVCPQLKPPQCFQAIALLRDIAKSEARVREVDHAIEWGSDYLQETTVLDVDLGDQTQRWGAFLHLDACDPRRAAGQDGKTLARSSIALRDVDGARLVRTGWFSEHVRSVAPRVAHTAIPALMAQAGWQGGPAKRVKATNPAGANALQWSFYVVPADWNRE